MPQTRARATARRRSSPSSRRSWRAPTRGRSSGAPPPSSAGALHPEGSASPWRRAAPFASRTSWWRLMESCGVARRRKMAAPSAWQQWAAPSALPLSTKLGTAVAGVVRDCVDPVARPLPCGEPKTVPWRQSAARTRTLAEPALRPVPAGPWRGRCPRPASASLAPGTH